MCAQLMLEYVDELEANIKAGDEVAANMDKWEPSTWPKECKGVGQCKLRAVPSDTGALLKTA